MLVPSLPAWILAAGHEWIYLATQTLGRLIGVLKGVFIILEMKIIFLFLDLGKQLSQSYDWILFRILKCF